MTSSPKRIGLVVGAGGPTGGPFMHAALDELTRLTAWEPSSAKTIVGTSAGAFVAASISREERGLDDDQWSALLGLANGENFAPRGIDRVAATLRRGTGVLLAVLTPTGRPFADYRVPAGPYHAGAHVVTVLRRPGRRVIHRLVETRDVVAVVRASAAIPVVNRPVKIGKALHIDGAVHSAANVDVVDVDDHDALVVLAPMVGADGGSVVTRFHRAQLRAQLRPWIMRGVPVIVVMPSEHEHADRRNVETFRPAGAAAIRRLHKRVEGH